MANMTDSLEKEIIDGILGVTQYTSPVTVYLALFTGDPTDTGSVISEATGINYTRLSLASLFAASTDGTSTNTSAIVFPAVGAGGWGVVTHIGIMKSITPTTDDMILWGELLAPISLSESDTFEILTGKLTVTLA